MNPIIRRYLAEIGRRGGVKSRRVLPSETARGMVRLREARRAFLRFGTSCFWSCEPNRRISAADIPWVVDQLQRNGGREAWDAAARLCR